MLGATEGAAAERLHVRFAFMGKFLLCTCCLLFLAVIGCDKSSQETSDTDSAASDRVESVPVDQLERGPIRHEELTEEQMARLQVLQQTLDEVFPSPIEDWVVSFKREQYPERELRIWEAIARAYASYCSTRQLNLARKKEIYEIILIRSMLSEEETLQQIALKYLSLEDAKQVMRGYNLNPAPLIVE